MKNFQNSATGQLKLTDGLDPTPLEVIVDTSVGDFVVNGPLKLVLNETVKVFARNQLVGTAPGARIIPTISFTGQVAYLSHATHKTVVDFLLGNESFATRVSTVDNDWTFHCDVTYTNGTDTIVCTDVEIVMDNITEGTEVNTIAFSGEVHGTVTINGVELAEYAAAA